MIQTDSTPAERIASLSQLADSAIAPHAAAVDEQARFPREAIKALGSAGWLGLNVPTALGGWGGDMRFAAQALEEVAKRDASAAMVYLMHLCACAAYSASGGKADDALRRAARGEHLGTLAWSERGSRSHFWAPVSKAAARSGGVVLNANKSFVTSAREADGFVVSSGAVTGTGATDSTLYLVRRDDAGVRVDGQWSGVGMRGNDSAAMVLSETVLPADRALTEDGKGFPRMLEILPWFNIGNAAVSIGIASAATASTLGHLTTARLEHLGQRLIERGELRARLARMQILVDTARAHLGATLDALDRAAPNALLLVLETKLVAAEAAVRACDLGMEACGGAAYAKRLTVERNFRDACASRVMAPTDDALTDFVGRAVGGMELFG